MQHNAQVKKSCGRLPASFVNTQLITKKLYFAIWHRWIDVHE
jgi:hypothetical protein